MGSAGCRSWDQRKGVAVPGTMPETRGACRGPQCRARSDRRESSPLRVEGEARPSEERSSAQCSKPGYRRRTGRVHWCAENLAHARSTRHRAIEMSAPMNDKALAPTSGHEFRSTKLRVGSQPFMKGFLLAAVRMTAKEEPIIKDDDSTLDEGVAKELQYSSGGRIEIAVHVRNCYP